ncbi:hypothetical protein PG985_003635 [Apiospora marii]|uniref:Heme haloperoxidase family profile domain-containing protein n=1 Tax=Apiospora marii TaxID=335849 RepID=A0ABR1SHI1_9PEZI
MQLHTLCGLLAVLPWCESSQEPMGHEWQAAKAGDSRGPCPMLNSLANHGFLPRDGRNINYQQATSVLQDALNFDPEPFVGQIRGAMQVSPNSHNGTTFDLVDLDQKPFEHDASLSRAEASTGDSLHFDPKVWAQTASHFGGKGVVSIETAAEARADRVATAKRTDPDFNLTGSGLSTSYAESGLYLIAFGDKTEGNARTDWIRSMFGRWIALPNIMPHTLTNLIVEEERLPYDQGWTRPQEYVSAADVTAMAQKIAAVPVDE